MRPSAFVFPTGVRMPSRRSYSRWAFVFPTGGTGDTYRERCASAEYEGRLGRTACASSRARRLLLRRAGQPPCWGRRTLLQEQCVRGHRELPKDSGEARKPHSTQGSGFEAGNRRLVDANQPAELALRPVVRVSKLANRAPDDRSAEKFRIRGLSR